MYVHFQASQFDRGQSTFDFKIPSFLVMALELLRTIELNSSKAYVLFLPVTVLLFLCSLPHADLGSRAPQLWHLTPPQCTFCIDKAWQPFNLGLLCTQRMTSRLHWGNQTSHRDVLILNHILFLPETFQEMTGQPKSLGYQPERHEAQGISTADKAKLYFQTLTYLFIVRVLICRSYKALGPYFLNFILKMDLVTVFVFHQKNFFKPK